MTAKVFVAGHGGTLGQAVMRRMVDLPYAPVVRPRQELNLLDAPAVTDFFNTEKPDYVLLLAAKVGGMYANKTYPADFFFENMTIQNNVIHNAYHSGVKKLVFLSSCVVYPENAPQPYREDTVLTGAMEEFKQPYSLAKIAGMKLCQFYRQQYDFDAVSLVASNLYGLGDNYDPERSHVIPSLIRRFHEAKINNTPTVEVWGTGNALREFLFVDDVADATVFALENNIDDDWVNVGLGHEKSVAEITHIIKDVVGYQGEIVFDASKPEGVPRSFMDNSKMKSYGWTARVSVEEGIKRSYHEFLELYN